MSGEPDISEKVSHHQRVPPPSPSASLRRNSLHSDSDTSYSSLRRSSTADSPYYSSPSQLSNSLRRSATNQKPSETPAHFSRYSSLLDDKHDRDWGTLPRGAFDLSRLCGDGDPLSGYRYSSSQPDTPLRLINIPG